MRRITSHASYGAPICWGDPAPVIVNTRLILAPDLASTIAQAGVDPAREGRALQDAILSAIADRRGYLSWDVDHAGWLVLLHSPD